MTLDVPAGHCCTSVQTRVRAMLKRFEWQGLRPHRDQLLQQFKRVQSSLEIAMLVGCACL